MKYKIAVLFSSGFVLFSVKMTIKKRIYEQRDTKKSHIANIQKVLYDEPVTEAGEKSIAS
jgi:hypothetical protein